MQAFKKILKVEGNKVLIELPIDFNYNEVEIIVLPHVEQGRPPDIKQKKDWKQDFLSISQWKNADAVKVESWPIQKF